MEVAAVYRDGPFDSGAPGQQTGRIKMSTQLSALLDALRQIIEIAQRSPELGETYTDVEARAVDNALTKALAIAETAIKQWKEARWTTDGQSA